MQTINTNASRKYSAAITIGHDERLVANQIIDAIAHRLTLYEVGGRLVMLQVGADGYVVSRQLTRATIRELISAVCEFYNESLQRIACPRYAPAAIIDRRRWKGIPVLAGIRRTPIFRTDGTLAQDRGYDDQSGYWLDVPRDAYGVDCDEITTQTATRARMTIDTLLVDFPIDAVSKAAWYAALVTPFLAATYTGPTCPMVLIDGNIRGVGKGLLGDLLVLIATGDTAGKQSKPTSQRDWQSMITSHAKAGTPIIFLDNVTGKLGGPALDAALTTDRWTDRPLMTNEVPTYPMRAMWMATGNNVNVWGDTTRRVLPIRLQSENSRPESRDLPDILAAVRKDRPRYVTAVLTMIADYFRHAHEAAELPWAGPWGSYNGWSDRVRRCVLWAGMPDPAEARDTIEDAETEALAVLLRAIAKADPDRKGLRVAAIIKGATRGLRDVLQTLCDGSPTTAKLGLVFRHFRGRVVDGMTLQRTTKQRGYYRWYVDANL